MALITLPPGSRWLKLLCKPRHGCDRMLPKRIWRAPNISTTGGATMPAPSPNWRLRGERYPTIRVSSNSPATFCRRRGQQEEGLRNLERAVELDPRNFILCNRSRSVTNIWGAMPSRSLRWIRALAIMPDNVETRADRGLIYLLLESGHPAAPPDNRCNPRARAGRHCQCRGTSGSVCALAERDPAAAERALVALGDNPCWGEGTIILSHSFGEGLLARMTKDEARARTAFEAARAQQEKIVQAQPDYGPALCVLGLIDAALGRKDLALDEGRRAIALTPLEKDVINGSLRPSVFRHYGSVGGREGACLAATGSWAACSRRIAHAELRCLKTAPVWDPLRGDPRFEQIVQSLAPK